MGRLYTFITCVTHVYYRCSTMCYRCLNYLYNAPKHPTCITLCNIHVAHFLVYRVCTVWLLMSQWLAHLPTYCDVNIYCTDYAIIVFKLLWHTGIITCFLCKHATPLYPLGKTYKMACFQIVNIMWWKMIANMSHQNHNDADIMRKGTIHIMSDFELYF